MIGVEKMGNKVSSVLGTECTLTIENCDKSGKLSFAECSLEIMGDLEELNLPVDILSTDPIADASAVQDMLRHLLHWTELRPVSTGL